MQQIVSLSTILVFIFGLQVTTGVSLWRGSHANSRNGDGDRVLKRQSAVMNRQHMLRRTRDDPTPTCSCDCCAVVARRPDEFEAGATIKCAPSEEHGPDTCGEQCAVAEGDQVLSAEAMGEGLDYQRFCFFECKPAAGLTSPIGEQCLILEETDAQSVVDKQGSAMDPAPVYGNSPVSLPVIGGSSASLVALTRARNVASKAAPAAVTPEDAVKASTDGRLQAQTQEKNALEEARKTSAHEALEAAGHGDHTFGALDEIRQSTKHAQAAASRASQQAASAAKAFQEARMLNWRTALDTAAQSVQTIRMQVRNEAEESMLPPPGEAWRKKAAKVAAAAAKPYLDSIRDAQQAVYDYSARAYEEAEQAHALNRKARGLEQIATALQEVGRHDEAVAKITEARRYAVEAQKLSEWTKSLYNTGGITAGSISTYHDWAQQAATKAAAEMKIGDDDEDETEHA